MNGESDRDRRLLGFLARPADPLPTTPGVVGPYRLVRRIGSGGSGTVYEADDARLHRRIALKVIPYDGEDAVPPERFLREFRIAGDLRHTGIVAVHDAGFARDPSGVLCFYLAMDLVQGQTLASVLRGPRPERKELLRMVSDLADAVAYAHACGVIHRDLKPGNVMVETGGRVLLVDFGTARSEALSTRLTRSTQVIGTPLYMAPEQVAGRTADIDARTDVHALGEILYEALTGRAPYLAPTPEAMFRHILEDEVERPRWLDPSIPAPLEAICLKAMDKNRDRRYQDAGAFLEDLRRAMQGLPVGARLPSRIVRICRKATRHPSTVLASLAIVGLAVVAGRWFMESSGRSEQARQELDRAVRAEREGRLEEALEATSAALAADPDLSSARRHAEGLRAQVSRRADAATTTRLVQEAETLAGPILKQIPTETINAGMIAILKDATDRLREAVRLDPSSIRAHILLGRVLEWLGDPAAAASYTEALRLQPANREARMARASLRARQADYAGAVEDFGTLLAVEPKALDALAGRAKALHRLDRTDEAFKDWAECLRLQPRHPSTLASRGSALLERGDVDGAERDFRLALEITPGNWPMRDVVERRLGQIQRIREARRRNP
jgi:serine/threonine protein kinase/cytochrome c-type biogenesis protein CcmH/NrfG